LEAPRNLVDDDGVGSALVVDCACYRDTPTRKGH